MSRPLSISRRRVLVDTSTYFALAVPRDANYQVATLLISELLAARHRQYTPNVVLVECHALLLARVGRARAAQFLQRIDAGNTTVIRVRAQDEAGAKAILHRYDDKDFSFADAISFAVMDRLAVLFHHHPRL